MYMPATSPNPPLHPVRSSMLPRPPFARFRRVLLALCCLGGAASAQSAPPARTFDVLLRHGRVLDGSGNPWMRADIGIRGDRIVAIGDLHDATATTIIAADSLYVAPGFIDTHSHAGESLERPALSGARQLLAQGLTTVFVNPDGGGRVDLDAQRAALQKNALGLNVALMVGHGAVRQAVLGMDDRAPTPEERKRMQALVQRGMDAGAFALSSGPFYAPGSYSKTDELVDLARVAARYGAPYQSHIRDESDYTIGLLAAVEEVITVAREAHTRGVVTHVKALGPSVWGFSAALVQRIDRARAQGVEVFADQYPYDASQTSLSAALVPRWAQAGGGAAFKARIADAAQRPRIVGEMRDNLARRGGAQRIQIGRYGPDSTIEGRTLAQIAAARGLDPVETALALLARGEAAIVSFNMVDEDIERLMRQPWTMTASDGALAAFGAGVPHPRGNGAFARKLHRYVVEDGVVDLAAAVRSMTSLPATVYNLTDRGVLRPGAFADVVVFDLATVRDRATYENPHQMAEGMVHVLVNGRFAVRDGKFTTDPGGRVLRR
jgi:N-acyl-D-amino-acid deacylase